MEILSSLLCLLLLFFISLHILIIKIRSKPNGCCKLPPGPTPFPVIGNLLELGDKPHKSLAKLAKIHGPIMSLKLGHQTTIVASSVSMAKEFLQTHDAPFSNPFTPDSLTPYSYGAFGLPFIPSSSSRWRIIRKISSAHVFNSKKFDENQSLRHKKVEELLSMVRASCLSGDAVDIGEITFITGLNNMWNTIFSVNLVDPHDTCSSKGIKEVVRGFFDETGKPNVADYFPVLKKIDPQGVRRRMTVYMGKMLEIFDQLIAERLRVRSQAQATMNNDFLDILLNVSEDNKGFERDKIKYFLVDLLIGGTETTSTTVEIAMAELLRNPRTLKKAQAEIREKVGKGKAMTEADLSQLPLQIWYAIATTTFNKMYQKRC